MIGRRIQDWTNQNIFVSSFDSENYPSYQNQSGPSKNQLQHIDEASTENTEKEFNDLVNVDEEGLEKGSITALQAIWLVYIKFYNMIIYISYYAKHFREFFTNIFIILGM